MITNTDISDFLLPRWVGLMAQCALVGASFPTLYNELNGFFGLIWAAKKSGHKKKTINKYPTKAIKTQPAELR